jgi:hypothetical protein
MMAKHYIDAHDPPPANVVKGISVYYGGKEHILYLNLVLSEGLEMHLIQNENTAIELSYPAEDKVVFSLRENLIHFIVISAHGNEGQAQAQGGLIRTDSVRYPWLPAFDGIRVSRMSEEEYKESWLSKSVFFMG